MKIPLFTRERPVQTADIVPSDEEIALHVISRFSRGNIRMQKGAILTREELDARAKLRAVQVARLKELFEIE